MGNLFVSVFQSGSTDQTPALLRRFRSALEALGVRNSINLGHDVRGGMNRIEFLAKVRNKAMDPIYTTDMHFDRVIWLSDNLFCASGPLQQIVLADDRHNGGAGADAACALDFDFMNFGQCGFYDIWAAHDYNGRNFAKPFPYVSHPNSVSAVQQHKPFQVLACWSGMVVFRADIFTKAGLLYRRGRANLGECPVAETELIFHDMWRIKRGRIVVAPNVATAYGLTEYERCVRGKQKTINFDATVQYASTAPPQFSCCPIDEHATFVDFGRCQMQPWDRPYLVGGIPRRKGFPSRRLQRDPQPARSRWPRDQMNNFSSWPDGTPAMMLPFAVDRTTAALPGNLSWASLLRIFEKMGSELSPSGEASPLDTQDSGVT